MKRTKPGFLLLDSMVGLTITVIGIMTLFWNITESTKVTKTQERRVDFYMAASIMQQTKVNQVVLHDHTYLLIKQTEVGVEIKDETAKQTIKLAK